MRGIEERARQKIADGVNFLCRNIGKQEEVSSSLKLEQTLRLKWEYGVMLKLVSLLHGIQKPEYIYLYYLETIKPIICPPFVL